MYEGSAALVRKVKVWTEGVHFEEQAKAQIAQIALMPFIFQHVAVMPDVHLGKGATVGSVIPTIGAIIPAAVGVDIGCGMMAVKTSLSASDLPTNLAAMRSDIEAAVPVGFAKHAESNPVIERYWTGNLLNRFRELEAKHPSVMAGNSWNQMGTLGGGNHFIEVCLSSGGAVWVMLHSGSRGVGNRIGSHFIALAKEDMGSYLRHLPDEDLAYLNEGTPHFVDYVEAVAWAQDYALANRDMMMEQVLRAMAPHVPSFGLEATAVRCHHNYISKEHHFGRDAWITRKGAVRARVGELGIIPGSMGARSYIVRGKGNPESFCSCSHGAGRQMSRGEAKKKITLERHAEATAGVECRKDADVIDESPDAYKPIDLVMKAQEDLVEVVTELKAVLCVKG